MYARHSVSFLVFMPGRACEIATRHTLDVNASCFPHEHGASPNLVSLSLVPGAPIERKLGRAGSYEVVGDYGLSALEPEIGESGKHLAFIRDGVWQNYIIGRNAVGGDHKKLIA